MLRRETNKRILSTVRYYPHCFNGPPEGEIVCERGDNDGRIMYVLKWLISQFIL